MKKATLSDRVVEYILHCPVSEYQRLSVSKLAEYLGVNRCYLSRKFKSEKNFTLCEFLIREKLLRSITILKDDRNVTIKDLSEKMGFANSNYFIRIFKSYFGTSPGRYRQCIYNHIDNREGCRLSGFSGD